ncbi:1-phosphofructokinase family hexose kinase [Breznakiella homolactica]|uniref:1-phosphofructokinase family hexose kinase n=1 Tax=Breznakiella homolactica TaxID=2798577 RepID=A0A7T7XPF7_9SPIR|nr:1-phosphofructokinase family hexose kinase [Breznakiella homolactica]QQO10109.1 1-phosphofructokinase family hexose kinase [Breznakiella homolactica]
MIRALCLNPAVDRFYNIDNFTHGFQFKNNIPHIAAGGKGINVARAAAGLGAEVEVRGFIGGPNGEFIRDEMERCGCRSDWITVPDNTRVTINIIDNAGKKESEIVEAGFTVPEDLAEEFLFRLRGDTVKGDVIICSGLSLPGLRDSIYREISGLCAEAGAYCFLDTSGDLLTASIGGRYLFAKPNMHELLALYGETEYRDEEQLAALGRRMRDSGIEQLMVSMGSRGALLLLNDKTYMAAVPKVKAEKTIGCGDAAVAGYAVSFIHGNDPPRSLAFSMACAVANSMNRELKSLDGDIIRDLLPQIHITELP